MHDPDLWQAWTELDDAGRHDEALRLIEENLEERPDDPHLHLLVAMSLTGLGPENDSLAAVHRAIECSGDDVGILTRSANICFYEGDLATARGCVDQARRTMPRGFPLEKELKELDRNLARREAGLEDEKRLSKAFNADFGNRRLAIDFARHLAHTGRNYTAYYVVSRGLFHHPDDRSLRRLEKKLRKIVPASERSEALQWAPTEEPTTISTGGAKRV